MKLERAEWGSDLPSVELQLEAQQHIHASVEELGSSVKEARLYEVGGIRNPLRAAGWLCDGAVYSVAVPYLKLDHKSLLHMKYLLLFWNNFVGKVFFTNPFLSKRVVILKAKVKISK